jgi:hypothetical protein
VGTAGKSLAFLRARCFFGLFGVCLCASCSVICGLFCGVGGRRFVAGVGWFGLGRWRVCVGLGDGCRGNATVMCGGFSWCSVSFGDSLWRFGVGLVVSSMSSSSPHGSGGDGGAEGRRGSIACVSVSGSARSGHPFLLARFVVVFCAGPWFSGDGVLVMSSCGLLLVGGLKQRAFGVPSGGDDSVGVVGRSFGASFGG